MNNKSAYLKSVTEGEHQTMVFEWANLHAKKYPELELLFHIPNGGYLLSPRSARRLKEQGLKKGYPDIGLDIPRKKFHGLRIELKKIGGRLSKEQIWWIDQLTAQGYFVPVCFGADAAIDTIKNYLGIQA